jgi:hypothetical protein
VACGGTSPACCSGQCKNTAGDVLNCGACGTICGVTVTLPNVATYNCAGGSCTVATCQSGFADCNAGAGCETAAQGSNACSTAEDLGTITDCCDSGVEVTRSAQQILPGRSRWYRVFSEDLPGDSWKTLVKVFNVTSGVNVDLYVYRRAEGATCGGASPPVSPGTSGDCNKSYSGCSGSQLNSDRCSQQGGNAAECVQWFEACSFPDIDSSVVWIEVRHVSGGCGTFDLKVRNNGDDDSLNCSTF